MPGVGGISHRSFWTATCNPITGSGNEVAGILVFEEKMRSEAEKIDNPLP